MPFDRITHDPARLNGQPCIRDLRLTVRRVLEAVAAHPDRQELLLEYPELQDEDIRQALEFAAMMLDDQGPGAAEGVETAWQEEAARRLAEFRSGAVQMVPWEEVCDGLRKKKDGRG